MEKIQVIGFIDKIKVETEFYSSINSAIKDKLKLKTGTKLNFFKKLNISTLFLLNKSKDIGRQRLFF